MKTAALSCLLFCIGTALSAQRLGFEQQTYEKTKLTVVGSDSLHWKAWEGDRRVSESTFWQLIGDKQFAKTAAAHGIKQNSAFWIGAGALSGLMSVTFFQGVAESDVPSARWGFAAAGALGSYLTFKAFTKKQPRFARLDQARAAAAHYNDSLRTSLRLSQ